MRSKSGKKKLNKSRSQSQNMGKGFQFLDFEKREKIEMLEKKENINNDNYFSVGIRNNQHFNSNNNSNLNQNLNTKFNRNMSSNNMSQMLGQQEKSKNIQVYARFRPYNKTEFDLSKNGFGGDSCLFPDEKTVLIQNDNQIFTMDKVFTGGCSQDQVYEIVGKNTIKDVMNGYNGTIFAYGQTGSGKTHSMFGDIHNYSQRGLIPRSIESIFKHIKKCDQDIDWVLSCSMLEIYKENLNDLLSLNKADLKIKESPIKGIYVEGLSSINVSSQRELFEILDLGEQMRKVSATRINQYSSRSHTIFMLEIKQRFANDSEKKGKLNLIDLAGSEKVHKTGASGDLLEEAKKINLSLSCLGNVIHSLTSGSDHIPYRDSKLTRILQESLGGNYKTSLLVTCSTHSSSLEETISTLKFASRAKSIQNHFKMNIKNSPEDLQKIIDKLRFDLVSTQSELMNFRRNYNNLEVVDNIPCEDKIKNIEQDYNSEDKEVQNLNDIIREQDEQIKKLVEENQKMKNSSIKYENKISQINAENENQQLLMEKNQNLLDQGKQQNLIQKQQIEKLTFTLQEERNKVQLLLKEKEQFFDQKYLDLGKSSGIFEKLKKSIQNLEKEKFGSSDSIIDEFRKKQKNYFEQNSESQNQFETQSMNSKSDLQYQQKKNKYVESYFEQLKKISQHNKIGCERISQLVKIIEETEETGQIKNFEQKQKQKKNSSQIQLALTLIRYELLRNMSINQNLDCNITVLELAQSLQYQKNKIKSGIRKMQQKQIESLENVLDKENYLENNRFIAENILKSENLRMQNKILVLSQELDLEICKSEKLQEALQQSNKHVGDYKFLLKEQESNMENKLKHEIQQFERMRKEVDNIVQNQILSRIQNNQIQIFSQQTQGQQQQLEFDQKKIQKQNLIQSQNQIQNQVQNQKQSQNQSQNQSQQQSQQQSQIQNFNKSSTYNNSIYKLELESSTEVWPLQNQKNQEKQLYFDYFYEVDKLKYEQNTDLKLFQGDQDSFLNEGLEDIKKQQQQNQYNNFQSIKQTQLFKKGMIRSPSIPLVCKQKSQQLVQQQQQNMSKKYVSANKYSCREQGKLQLNQQQYQQQIKQKIQFNSENNSCKKKKGSRFGVHSQVDEQFQRQDQNEIIKDVKNNCFFENNQNVDKSCSNFQNFKLGQNSQLAKQSVNKENNDNIENMENKENQIQQKNMFQNNKNINEVRQDLNIINQNNKQDSKKCMILSENKMVLNQMNNETQGSDLFKNNNNNQNNFSTNFINSNSQLNQQINEKCSYNMEGENSYKKLGYDQQQNKENKVNDSLQLNKFKVGMRYDYKNILYNNNK
ncbi:P-loop containing nucleoside triphosphate hydrolase [Pseudocohnilembus persalinus]|uniref:p-loop containing nucleoside triphosphate hydrolase n=1 Tax=Pseudocohnilembus persalinus TaxID=266149 RepID=A0A0V0R309_PSEPJ|nr:P-loop containing nucleoside triphosphate hydrolase [Pseudocohnilembus persalinus]|eukprot:KRX08581.1 P-loop containing nucleoside triphosphate hydrolase [Pseudocohnilembus persalinus]